MTVFELNANSKHAHIYGIRMISGQCLWFNTRDERDIAFIELQ